MARIKIPAELPAMTLKEKDYLSRVGLIWWQWRIVTDYPYFLQIENIETKERKIIDKLKRASMK